MSADLLVLTGLYYHGMFCRLAQDVGARSRCKDILFRKSKLSMVSFGTAHE